MGADERRALLIEALSGVATGRQAALRTVYDATRTKLYQICLRICVDREAAADALQDTYISVWRRAGTFDPLRASPITWLATIARNKSIDRLRGKVKVRLASDDELAMVEDCRVDNERTVLRADAQRWIDRYLARADAVDASIFAAIFTERVTYTVLAVRLAMPVGTLKSRVRRLLMTMRTELQQQEARGEAAFSAR